MSKNGFSLKTSLQIHCYTPIQESGFYLHWLGFYNSNKVKNAYIMTHSVASFNATKKCGDFCLPGVESFPTMYNMKDFAVIIVSRYYTLT